LLASKNETTLFKKGLTQNQNSKMKNKKAGMSIPIVVLVIFTLVLTLVTLAYFSTRDETDKKTLIVPGIIDGVYLEEAQLNYLLEDIFNKASKDLKFEDGKEVFINNFKKELERYKSEGEGYSIEGLEQVHKQINDEILMGEGLELNEEKITLKLGIELFAGNINEKEDIKINYKYEKEFEKVFKG